MIVSNKTDLATDYLVVRLHERGIPFLRINTEDYLLSWDVCFSIEKNGTHVVIRKEGQESLPVGIFTGAYIRQPKMPDLDIVDDDKEFSRREVGETLKSIWRAIDDRIWLNAPRRLLLSSNKPEQLTIANSIGFNIPDTYVGSNYESIKKFYEANSGKIVAKAVKHGFNFDGDKARVAATQKVDESALASIKDYAAIPMIFQNHIEKEYDIRVIVVGSNVFATAIESQCHEETKTDWRLSDCYKIPLRQYEIKLPREIISLCLEITKRFNLRYSAIDLVLGSLVSKICGRFPVQVIAPVHGIARFHGT
ncbi:MAG: hypothetical protein P8X79_21790 [Reinekea sp.]